MGRRDQSLLCLRHLRKAFLPAADCWYFILEVTVKQTPLGSTLSVDYPERVSRMYFILEQRVACKPVVRAVNSVYSASVPC